MRLTSKFDQEKCSPSGAESPVALDICVAQDLITTLSPRRSGWPKGKRREINRIGRNSGWLSAVREVTAWWIQGYQAVKKPSKSSGQGIRVLETAQGARGYRMRNGLHSINHSINHRINEVTISDNRPDADESSLSLFGSGEFISTFGQARVAQALHSNTVTMRTPGATTRLMTWRESA